MFAGFRRQPIVTEICGGFAGIFTNESLSVAGELCFDLVEFGKDFAGSLLFFDSDVIIVIDVKNDFIAWRGVNDLADFAGQGDLPSFSYNCSEFHTAFLLYE